eukprot:826918-Rhodomonas_salina.2
MLGHARLREPAAFGTARQNAMQFSRSMPLERELAAMDKVKHAVMRKMSKEFASSAPLGISLVTLDGESLSAAADLGSALTSFEATGATQWSSFEVEEIFSTDRGRNLAEMFERSRGKSMVPLLSKVTVAALERVVNDPTLKLDDNVGSKPVRQPIDTLHPHTAF